MKQYLNEWKVVEGSLVTQGIKELPDCLEKDHLSQIREMLKKERFDSDQSLVVEYSTIGMYCCNHINDGKYFIIQEHEGQLTPFCTTWEMSEEGINDLPCESIEDSASHTEC